MTNPQMAPRVPPEIKKLANIKAELNGESLGEYIARLIETDCKDLKNALTGVSREEG